MTTGTGPGPPPGGKRDHSQPSRTLRKSAGQAMLGPLWLAARPGEAHACVEATDNSLLLMKN